jgi:hypothetical protein
MALPTTPVTLDVAQVEELARHFSSFRHDVNGCLSLIVAATELIRYSPDVVKRMSATLVEQPPRIAGKTVEFVMECERALGIRPPNEQSWYRDLWKRHNAAPAEPVADVSLTADAAKELHTELLALGKELMQTSFIVSGASVIAGCNNAAADDVTITGAEQLNKLSKKFDHFATLFEQSLRLNPPAPRRLASGAPSGPVTLSPDRIALFHRKLTNLQRDMAEHLKPLLELSRLARTNPGEVQARASEFAQQPPKISSEVSRFSNEFDAALGIVRATS